MYIFEVIKYMAQQKLKLHQVMFKLVLQIQFIVLQKASTLFRHSLLYSKRLVSFSDIVFLYSKRPVGFSDTIYCTPKG